MRHEDAGVQPEAKLRLADGQCDLVEAAAASPAHPRVTRSIEFLARLLGICVAVVREQRAAAEVGKGLAVPGGSTVGRRVGHQAVRATVAPAVLLPVAAYVV